MPDWRDGQSLLLLKSMDHALVPEELWHSLSLGLKKAGILPPPSFLRKSMDTSILVGSGSLTSLTIALKGALLGVEDLGASS